MQRNKSKKEPQMVGDASAAGVHMEQHCYIQQPTSSEKKVNISLYIQFCSKTFLTTSTIPRGNVEIGFLRFLLVHHYFIFVQQFLHIYRLRAALGGSCCTKMIFYEI